MEISLKDIAARLNLSKTTVSWVLSGQGEKKGISLETRRRVIDCANKLSYQPNLLARSLNTGKTKTLGLILPSISDSFYSEVAYNIESKAKSMGYSLMISSSNSEIKQENEMIRLFQSRKVDGMIIAPTKISKREISRLIDSKLPLVLFDRFFPELDTNYVIIDNENTSYNLTMKLIARGYRKIAIITTNPHLLTMDMRREGYVNALSDSGLNVDPLLYGDVQYVDYKKNLDAVMDRIFSSVPDVDAFLFTTHILAIEGFKYLSRKGVSLDDGKIGLASMHYSDLFRLVAPKIDYAEFPVKEMGEAIVNILIKQIKAYQENKDFIHNKVVLPCKMNFR